MKKLLFPLFMLAMIVTSCEKDPDMNKLDSDYSVYTDYDNSAHFNEFSTYYLPDSILALTETPSICSSPFFSRMRYCLLLIARSHS